MALSSKKLKEKRKRKLKFKKFIERRRGRWADSESIKQLDYKNVDLLQKMITAQGKIFSRKRSGACAQAQGELKRAIKQARYMALLPYTG